MMARQRPPIARDLPFTYWVFGRPVSTQNEEGGKPRALPRWRAGVVTALEEAIDAVSKGRGLVPIADPVELRIVWLSVDPSDPALPDLDNMLKPLIDALNLRVIEDDRQVHRVVAERASINRPPRQTRDIIADIQDDARFTEVGEVVIVRVVAFQPEYRP